VADDSRIEDAVAGEGETEGHVLRSPVAGMPAASLVTWAMACALAWAGGWIRRVGAVGVG
jgi:hypothetical protein